MASIERGVLEAMQGHTERGHERVARGRQEFEELGLALGVQVMAQGAAIVEQMAGDASAAETLLRFAFDRLHEMGEAGFQMTVAGMLSRALYAHGKLDEARRFAALCRLGDEDDDEVRWQHGRIERNLAERAQHLGITYSTCRNRAETAKRILGSHSLANAMILGLALRET